MRVILTILIFLVSGCKSNNHPAGIWSGSVNTAEGSTEVIISIEKRWFNSVSCKISFPEQYVVDYPATSVSLDGSTISFGFSNLFTADFKGEISGDSMTGMWTQNKIKTPLSFAKSPGQNFNRSVKTALLFCKDNSVNSGNIDWTVESNKLLNEARAYPSVDDIESPLKYLLEILKDKHGGISKDGEWMGYNSNQDERLSKEFIKSSYGHRKEIFSMLLSSDLGYIRVPSSPADEKELPAYTSKLHSEIKRFSESDCKNLILDFRLNEGGNVFSMIAGLRDLLGAGQVAKFYKPLNKDVEIISLQNDGVYTDQKNVFPFGNDLSLHKVDFNIAILISPATASAAEGAIISLKSVRNVKIFGEPSKGLTTTLRGLVLQDIKFFISTSYLCDVNDIIYTDRLSPDVLITGGDDFNNLQNDAKVLAARTWLNGNFANIVSGWTGKSPVKSRNPPYN